MKTRLVSYLCIAIVLAFSLRAMATVAGGTSDDSIELAVATATDVVFGHIVSAEQTHPPGFGDLCWKITVKVEEPIIGATRGEEIVYWEWYDPPLDIPPRNISADAKSQLFILEEYKSSGNPPQLYRTHLAIDADSIYSSWQNDLILDLPTMAMTRFKNRSEVVAAILPYCARPHGRILQESVRLRVGLSSIPMDIPLDARSELLAQQWVRAPDSLSKWNAIRVLRNFKSPVNIELLRPIAKMAPRNDIDESSRESAMDTLASWGFPVQPFSRFKTPSWYEWMDIYSLLFVAILIVVPWRYWRSSRLKRGDTLFWRTTVIVWLTLVTFTILLWGRSYLELDAVNWGRWQLVAIRGQAIALRSDQHDSNVQWPLAYCRPEQMKEIKVHLWPWLDTETWCAASGPYDRLWYEEADSFTWKSWNSYDLSFPMMEAALALITLLTMRLRAIRRRLCLLARSLLLCPLVEIRNWNVFQF
jgi:hypothetical protein